MLRLPVLLLAAIGLQAATPDYSKEALVLDKLRTEVRFQADGTSVTETTVVVRVQSEAAARQLGVLSTTSTNSEKTDYLYVRVRKPDGKTIETAPSDAMDVGTQVAQIAPMYSDLHQKQLPVKGLASGDTLEFATHTSHFKAEIPNQYWFAFSFDRENIVLDENLDVYAPKDKQLNVVAPEFKPSVTDEAGVRHYAWHYTQLKPTPTTPDKTPKSMLPKRADIQMTTFNSWDELGAWYNTLLLPQAAVTPAVAEKAAEITKGLTTPQAKARALYEYVAMKYRYISISFGTGRYMPHTADEVVQNNYGDCKDKHTLLVALLRASGIDASTVLLGSGLAFDPAAPSPSQFNHVITAIRIDGHTDLVDTTAEVAPYGLLFRQIRDHEAVQIDSTSKTSIVRTPADPPFPTLESIQVDSALSNDGVLTGHFDMTFRGDSEFLLRAMLRETAPAQWPEVIQNFSRGLNFGGDVSNVAADNVNDLAKPIHLSYDYRGTNYADWAEHKISPPLPPLALPYEGADPDKPVDDIDLPASGKIVYHAIVRLPKEFVLDPPKAVAAASPYATYTAQYAVKDGVLTVDRVLESKKSKAPVSDWVNYRRLATAVYDDHNQWMELKEAKSTPPAATSNEQAAALIRKAWADFQAQNLLQGKADLEAAKKLAPTELGLWSALAFEASAENNPNVAVANAKKEIELHPDSEPAYKQALYMLGMQKNSEGQIPILEAELKHFPHQQDTVLGLASKYTELKRWAALVSLVEEEKKANTNLDTMMQTYYVAGLLETGKKTEGLALAQKLKGEAEFLALKNLAWQIEEADADLNLAAECADTALAQLKKQTSGLDLDHFENADLLIYEPLAATWDTAGWIRFKMGKLAEAEEYVSAAWRLNPSGTVADHLGQIFQKEGKLEQAAEVYRMGLATDPKSDSLRQRLNSVPSGSHKQHGPEVNPFNNLNTLRTLPLSGFARDSGTGEYFMLFANGKVLDDRLTAGELAGADVDAALRRISYSVAPVGDETKIIRKGILSCSAYTNPKCQLVLMSLQDTRK